MPENVVRENLETLDIRAQRVTQLSSGRRDQDPAKNRPLTPLHFMGGAVALGVQSAFNH